MGWFNTALKVANIAGQILSQLPADAKTNSADNDDYRPGGVSAYWDAKANAPYIKNITDRPVGLNFVDFIGSGESQGYSSSLIHLKAGMGVDPSQEFDFYRQGELSMFDASPQPATNGSDEIWRNVAFGVTLVLGAVATAIVGGVAVGIRRTATTTEIYIERRGVNLEHVNLNVVAGTSIDMTFASDDTVRLADQTMTFTIPQGADLSNGARVSGTMMVDQATYDALVEPNSHRVHALD